MIRWNPILRPASIAARMVGASVSGGRSLAGSERVVQADAGWWSLRLTFPTLDPAQVLAFRAMLAQLQLRAGTIAVPFVDCAQTPGGMAGDSNPPAGIPHDDDSLHSDGSGYDGQVVVAETASSGALNATALTLSMTSGHALYPGQYFSIADRAYILRTAVNTAGLLWSVTFWPPLRVAVATGADVQFDHPTCEMRLASDDTGELEMHLARWASPTLDFVEASV